MARIPDTEIERLKSEVSVERLVEASGIELKRAGKDLLGRCPFLEDDTASLVCRRRSKSEPPCRPNIEPGVEADFEIVGCG